MDSFLKKVKLWLGKVRHAPVLGSMAEDLMTLIDLMTDYRAGIYRNLPKGVFLSAVFGLGYALFPVDLILDIIPIAGYLDDAAILMLLLDFFIARDIARYRSWKTGLQSRGLYALREQCTADILALIGEQHLAAAFKARRHTVENISGFLGSPSCHTHIFKIHHILTSSDLNSLTVRSGNSSIRRIGITITADRIVHHARVMGLEAWIFLTAV